MIVPARSLISEIFFNKEFNEKSFDSSINFTLNGRTALKRLALELNLKSGDKILIPGLICSSAIEEIIDLGLNPIYYDIDIDLKINWENILKHIHKNNIKAILIVNYFGFIDLEKQKVLSLCKKNNLIVLDDYCHSFLTFFLNRENIAIHGEHIFFNLNKIIRIKSGGFIQTSGTNNQKNYKVLSRKKINIIFGFLLNQIELINNNYSLINIFDKNFLIFKRIFLKIISFCKVNKNFDSKKLNSNIPIIFSENSFLKKIKEKRIENFNMLYDSLIDLGITPIQKITEDISVPQNLSIFDNSGLLNKYLNRKGIGSYNWPAEELPRFNKKQKSELQNTLKIHKRIVCLPIHQSINKKNIKYMAKVISKYYATKNKHI